ncbi:type VI secretion system baseplate subunit TssF [Aequorivita capsosiphonis]|uniref:type VI secretion system baseplate subunit TssF n=1 Tax=Aequorivita capsosiphonis TaxID=487317 RepID=UPI0003FDAD39|nr:type VI secretion system baseplate subunit TssF [Aequorivita capsosiphonis]
MFANNEEDIKTRMIQKAASIWGIAPKDIDSSFDPLVSLLIGACASEIGKIEGEIHNSQTRITERLIQLMTPEAIHGAHPAQAVAFAEPVEKVMTLRPENQLVFLKKVRSKEAGTFQKNLFLSPARTMRLIDAEVTHLISGNKLFSQESINGKKVEGTLTNHAEPSKLYLGIRSNYENLPLKDVSFYFELQDPSLNDLFYHHLKNAIFTLDGEKLTIIEGFFDNNESERMNMEAFFSSVTNKTKTIEDRTNQYFKKNFISVKSLSYLTKKGSGPKGLLSDADIEKYGEIKDLNWVELEFPRIIDSGVLEQVFCTLNAFPVLNRKLNAFSYQLKDFINIIPIQTNDMFSDIKIVENTDGRTYQMRHNSTSADQKGTFVIREDQAGKLDSRNAKQFISHMMELMKEESASFSFLGSDFLQSNINKLNQTILLLEKRAEDLTEKTRETVYISVKPYRQRETLMIEYWTTDGSLANKTKAGTVLANYEGTDLKQKGAVLLTTTFNGKDSLSMEQRLNNYRSSLLSRDRIVTKQDVGALCHSLYNDKISKVEVEKAYTADISTNKGVLPCMKIILYKNKNNKLNEKEWQLLNNNLLTILEKKSVNVFPYVIEMKT